MTETVHDKAHAARLHHLPRISLTNTSYAAASYSFTGISEAAGRRARACLSVCGGLVIFPWSPSLCRHLRSHSDEPWDVLIEGGVWRVRCRAHPFLHWNFIHCALTIHFNSAPCCPPHPARNHPESHRSRLRAQRGSVREEICRRYYKRPPVIFIRFSRLKIPDKIYLSIYLSVCLSVYLSIHKCIGFISHK